jgi:hypothetical protein
MTVLDTKRAQLALLGRWPIHSVSGDLSPAQRRLVDADRIRACLACGGPVLVPDGRIRGYAQEQAAVPAGMVYVPDDLPPVERWLRNGWEAHDDCAAGVERWGAAWPAIAVAAELEQPGRVPRPLDPRLAGEIASACQPCTDCPPTERDQRVQVPLFVNAGEGADARRPVRPWSHVDTPALRPGAWMWRHPTTGRMVEAGDLPTRPTMRQVVAAELDDARDRIHLAERVPPSAVFPCAGAACHWCGVGRAPRRSWEMPAGGPWCGRADVCPPPVVGNPLTARAQVVGRLLDEPYDLSWVRQAETMGQLPVVVWSELPAAERRPQQVPFGWLSDADLDGLRALFDTFEQQDDHIEARMAASRADRRAAEAHEARMAEIEARAVEAAEARADELVTERLRPDPADVERIAKKVAADVIADNNRQWRERPVQVDALGRPVGSRRRR